MVLHMVCLTPRSCRKRLWSITLEPSKANTSTVFARAWVSRYNPHTYGPAGTRESLNGSS
jgi:hypothetical protein